MKTSLKQKKIIGIVGGLGPFAHIEFEKRLLNAAVKLVNAKNDQSFPSWLLSSMPQTPDRTCAICGGGESPVPAIVKSLRYLDAHYDKSGNKISGADFAVMICNTSYCFLSEVKEEVSIPLLNIIDLTTERISLTYPGARVGILATSGTLQSDIYHDSLKKYGLIPKSPLDLPDGPKIQNEMIMESIYGKWDGNEYLGGGIKSGNVEERFIENFNYTAIKLVEAFDVEVFIAGCTEIPIAIPGSIIMDKVLMDPMTIAAEEAIKLAYGLVND